MSDSRMSEPMLDQFWECPKCGTQVGMGAPAVTHPPMCQWFHETTEMEQKTATAFGDAA